MTICTVRKRERERGTLEKRTFHRAARLPADARAINQYAPTPRADTSALFCEAFVLSQRPKRCMTGSALLSDCSVRTDARSIRGPSAAAVSVARTPLTASRRSHSPCRDQWPFNLGARERVGVMRFMREAI